MAHPGEGAARMPQAVDRDGLRASTASTAFLTAVSQQSPAQEVAEEPLSLLFTWGDGHGGALGHGGVRKEVSPRLCTLLVPFKLRTAACGGGYTLVALASGELCSCGSGAGGVLGHGDEKDRGAFEVVQALQGTKVVSLAAGERHCAAVSDAGSLFSWGDGSDMQLGLPGDAGVQLAPQPVLQLGADVHKELASALGDDDGDDDGGEGGGGEVGSPRKMSLASKTALMNALRCASVACGGSHSLSSLRSGAVCSWGCGGAQLGHGAIAHDVPLPQKIGSLSGVRAVATGVAHSMAVTGQGQLWAWGHNGEGQLGAEVTPAKGQRRTHEAPRPLRLASLAAVKVRHVACGGYFTLALTAAGDTLSWGDGSNGQLGHGACTSEAAPRVVKALLGKRARLAACGAAHSAVLCASGDAHLFGRNGDGELGLGDASGTDQPLPTLLPACAASGLTVSHVACGRYHTAAIVHLLPAALEPTLGRIAAAALRQRLRGGSTLATVASDSGGGAQPSLQYEALAAAPRALTATLVRPPPPPPSLEPPPLSEAQAREARDAARREAVVQAEHRRAALLTRRTMSDRLGALGGRCCEALKGSANLSEELDRMAHGQQQLHSWQRRTVHKLDAQAQRYAQAVLQIEDEDRVWRRLESSRRAASITASAQAEKAAANELSLWDRRLPAHLRLGAEFGLRREEQSSLQKLQRQAEAAAAAAAAVRDAHLGGLSKSASVPALLTSMRHRPPQLKPLVRAARY